MRRISSIFAIMLVLSIMIAGCAQPDENVTATPVETTPSVTETPTEPETPATTASPVTPIKTDTDVGTSSSPSPTDALETPPLPPIGAESVSITESGFDPDTVTVPEGTTVIWANDSEMIQIITFAGPAGSIDLGAIEPGDSASYTFTKAGTYAYRSEGAGYLGTVIVTADATV